MTLNERLRQVLPEHLPEEPSQALSGTELVARLLPFMQGEYAENSIRQTLSVLAGDPTSPIARLEGSHGYYRRPLLQASSAESGPDGTDTAPANTPAEPECPGTGREHQAEEKFRAFYLRLARWDTRFPMRIEHLAGQRQTAGVNKWKFPDLVVLDWDAGKTSENGCFSLDPSLLEVKRGLGERPFKLTSVELKVELSLGSFREHFFQCVSNSMWAHHACLAVAMPVQDSLLAAELRRLGASYGVEVQTFGLTKEKILSLPAAKDILKLGDDAFEQLAGDIPPMALSPGKVKASLDWEHIRDMKAQSPEFNTLFDWIARCLRDGRAYPVEDYLKLLQIEKAS